MQKYNLEIELVSDLCVADGRVYNSMLDTDICYDSYGFPYIPGKRIKGCLRECALELNDWGKNIDIEAIFGGKGNQINRGKIRVGDARLEGYQDYINETNNSSSILYHPQNVLGQFTYIRTQTSIDIETGVAKDTGLRTMRVINRGNRFVAEIILEDEELYYSQLSDTCQCLRNIGLARTRGLGEVKCTLKQEGISGSEDNAEGGKTNDTNDIDNGERLLQYRILLEEPLICKSINGGEANSMDYIEGAKIIGLLATQLKNPSKLKEYLDEGVKFSNAYITCNGDRALSAGAYLYEIKNNDNEYINKLYFEERTDEQRQFSGLKSKYVHFYEDGKLERVSVRMEERYHHSRPSDKSIGRSDNSSDSKLYQISSIKSKQIFSGYISGTKELLSEVFNILKEVDICYLGYGRGSEYGKCKFHIEGVDTAGTLSSRMRTKCFAVMLNAPAIIYNENAMYSMEKEDLLEEILAAINLKRKDVKNVEYFVRYTSVGGYNVTWKARKPVIRAFDKGTTVKVSLKEEKDINSEGYMWLGERSSEGFGEFICRDLTVIQNESQWKFAKQPKISTNPLKSKSKTGSLGLKIYRSLLDGFIRERASDLVKEHNIAKESYRATISNLIQICKEQDSLKDVKGVVKERFSKNTTNKRDKSAAANMIIQVVEKSSESIDKEFADSMGLMQEDYVSKNEIEMKLLKQILIEAKYQIRMRMEENNNSKKRKEEGNE